MKAGLSLLFITASEADLLPVTRHIAEAGYEVNLKWVDNPADFVAALHQQPWDIILADDSPPCFTVFDALRILEEITLDIPLIIVSDGMSEETGIQAMKAGADDYIFKNNLVRLVPAIEREIGDARERHQRSRADRKLQLTGLLLEKTFASLRDVVLVTEQTSRRVVMCNAAVENVLGYSRAELTGQSVMPLFTDRENFLRFREAANAVLDRGKIFHTEHLIRRKDGSTVLMDLTVTPIFDLGDETNRGAVLVMRDISIERQQEQMLQRAVQLLEKTFASLDEVVLVIEKQARQVLMCNAAARTILGYEPDELIGQSTVCLYTDEDAYYELRKMAEPALDEGASFHTEYPLRRKDGAVIITEIMITPVLMPGNEELGVVFVIKDITERKQAEAAEREQRTLAEALRDTTTALTSTLELKEVIRRILENVWRVVPHESANIMLIEGDACRIEYMQGYAPETEEQLKNQRFSFELPNLRSMFVTGKPCLVSDTTTSPMWEKIEGTEWIRSHIGAPLRRQGQVIGFINLDSSIPEFYTPEHLDRLQAFADQAAIAIENAQVYNTLSSFANEMAALNRATSSLFAPLSTSQTIDDLANQIVSTVVRAFGKVDCGIMLVDREQNQLVRLARAGDYNIHATRPLYLDGPGLSPEAVRRGETVYAPDVSKDPRYIVSDHRTRSEIVIPLRTHDDIIGVLDLQSAETDAFGMNDQRMLKAFAERAATAIENARLYEEVQSYATMLEHRVAERTVQLEQAREHVETILNSSSEAIVLAHRDGTIRQTNPAFDDMLLYEVDENFGKSLVTLVTPDRAASLAAMIHHVVERKEPARMEAKVRRKDESTFEAELAVSPIQDRKNGVSGIVCTFHDITRHKQIEEYLREALEKERELNELKSRFVSMVSHEFRTPLATIQVTIDSLANYFDKFDTNQRARRFEKIYGQIRHMTDLLEDTLTFSRGESGTLQLTPARIDLSRFCKTIIEEVQQTMSKPNPVHFIDHITDPDFVADERLIRQMMTNLLTNAIKYSPGGDPIEVEATCNQGILTLQVRDRGIGIPEKDKKHLFEAFHRARNVGAISGTGLGLVITRHVVDLHGGTITFDSEEGKGTTFTITLPTIQEITTHDQNPRH